MRSRGLGPSARASYPSQLRGWRREEVGAPPRGCAAGGAAGSRAAPAQAQGEARRGQRAAGRLAGLGGAGPATARRATGATGPRWGPKGSTAAARRAAGAPTQTQGEGRGP